MSELKPGLRRWALLAALLPAGLLWSGPTSTDMHTLNQARTLSGTYRVVFCRHTCTLADSSTAIATGYIILSQTPIKLTKLPKEQREYLGQLYRAIALQKEPNGCFVLRKQHPEHSVAAALPVGFTSWESHRDSTVNLDFFRAPDSGYTVYLTVSDDIIRGVGQFWSGNGPEAQLPPDSIYGRRIGAANPARCIDAARRGTGR